MNRRVIPRFRKKRQSTSLCDLEKAAGQNGAMVASYLSADVADALAQPEGEAAEDLHLTLAFLGEAGDLKDPERLQQVVEGFAATAPPLTGEISGIGHFTAGPEPVTYASPDLPGLPELRERLCEALCGAGYEPSADHGYTPHITLAYESVDPDVPNLALAFNEITLTLAGERFTYPLTGKQAAEQKDAPVKKTGDATWDTTVPVWKDDAKQIIYGVVMQPDVPDSQGDTVTAEEIEQAAHRYLIESRKSDVQHEEEQLDAVPVESWIAPSEMEVAGRAVLKGSWVMAVQVNDTEVWAQVQQGELTGFSIGGTAVREDT